MTFSTLPDSKVGVQRQDGHPPGVVEQLVMQRYGTLRAELSNGRAEKIAQVKLARFVNPSGLKQVGDGVFKPTSESRMPNEGVAGTDGFGAVIGSALEQSNTNLVDELSAIVQCQLAFTANSSAIDKQSAMVKSLIDKV
jgi:flagellar basal-body rod protein FlgG